MIVLDDFEQIKSQHGTRGNQMKFYNDGMWYKLDNLKCNEGLAEEFASKFCACINGMSYVPYKSDKYMYHGEVYNGCECPNMYWNNDIEFINTKTMWERQGEEGSIFTRKDVERDRIPYVVSYIKSLTGVDTGSYFARLAYLDSIIVNVDRHYMNVGVCYDKGQDKYMIAPCFDNGSAFLCVNWYNSHRRSLDENIAYSLDQVYPFVKWSDKQVELFKEFGFPPLYISKSKVTELLNTYENNNYSPDLVARCKYVLEKRLRETEGVSFEWVM